MRSFTLAPLFMIALTGCVAAQNTPRQTERLDARIERGRVEFGNNCASCHGRSGQGDGPLQPFLTVAVPDITRSTSARRGEALERYIEYVIDGRADVIAHGPREMPVWGNEFRNDNGMQDVPAFQPQARDVRARIQDITAYVMSIQD